jgi:hypothetical protein
MISLDLLNEVLLDECEGIRSVEVEVDDETDSNQEDSKIYFPSLVVVLESSSISEICSVVGDHNLASNRKSQNNRKKS